QLLRLGGISYQRYWLQTATHGLAVDLLAGHAGGTNDSNFHVNVLFVMSMGHQWVATARSGPKASNPPKPRSIPPSLPRHRNSPLPRDIDGAHQARVRHMGLKSGI